MRKRILILLGVIVSIVSCEKKEQEVPVSSVSITQATAEMIIGETIQLSASVQPSNATEKTISWASSKISVATVSNGKVTAIAEGVSTITASCGGKTATCQIVVSRSIISVTDIQLDVSSLELREGETAQIIATVYPDNADDKTIIWTSSDENVAVVNDGIVTAIKSGTASVSATSGSFRAYCSISVYNPRPQFVDMGLSVSWASFNIGAEKLEELGDLFAWGEIETKESFSWENYKFSRGDKDSITKYTKKDGIKRLELIDDAAYIKWGEGWRIPTISEWKDLLTNCEFRKVKNDKYDGYQCKSKVTGNTIFLPSSHIYPGSEASYWSSTWSNYVSSAEAFDIDVIVNTGEVFPRESGGNRSAGRNIRPVHFEIIPVTSITLSNSQIELKVGDEFILSASIFPENASDKTVKWSSSNPDIASIDNGKVKALNEGKVVITASAGEKTATCSVTISGQKVTVTSVTLNKSSITLNIGDSDTIVATVKPDNATDKNVTWSTSKAEVATVDGGRVTAVKEGEAIITAKAGEKSATCKVTVKNSMIAVTSITLNKTTSYLIKGQSETLTATVTPDNATDKTITWSSTDATVASVDQTGKVTALKSGKATITAKAGEKIATCEVRVKGSIPEGAVDLGLSVYWATCNLSESGFVSSPEAYGDYYAWGETETKPQYSWSTYKFGTSSSGPFSKYNTNSSNGDNKTILDAEDDVAHVKLGGSWRLPTRKEWDELINSCTCTWTDNYNGTGVKGSILTSKVVGYTDKFIFLPAAGYRRDALIDEVGSGGYYWSSSLCSDASYCAFGLRLGSGNYRNFKYCYRYVGQPIRSISE